jgi:hypothetical protein
LKVLLPLRADIRQAAFISSNQAVAPARKKPMKLSYTQIVIENFGVPRNMLFKRVALATRLQA